MQEYPFTDRVKEQLLLKKRSINWLLGEIDKSNSWFFHIKSMFDLQMKTILEISKIVEFDFIRDYYEWMGNGNLMVSEPSTGYIKEPEMSIQLTIKGASATFTKNLGKLLDVIVEEGAKAGLKVG